jgi:hypothetical protein
MTLSPLKKNLLGLLSILIPLLLLFAYTAFNSGPLMPIHITQMFDDETMRIPNSKLLSNVRKIINTRIILYERF